MNILKEEHEFLGLKYPRPTIPCPDCDKLLTICWGETHTIPYTRHKGEKGASSSCSGGTGEGAKHYLAKIFFVNI